MSLSLSIFSKNSSLPTCSFQDIFRIFLQNYISGVLNLFFIYEGIVQHSLFSYPNAPSGFSVAHFTIAYFFSICLNCWTCLILTSTVNTLKSLRLKINFNLLALEEKRRILNSADVLHSKYIHFISAEF